jgi:hypothetical protein|tara:strand:- start:1083 stop:1193 length:111 start_codon:yes stop_codon:yes gene_type:complete
VHGGVILVEVIVLFWAYFFEYGHQSWGKKTKEKSEI